MQKILAAAPNRNSLETLAARTLLIRLADRVLQAQTNLKTR